MTKPLEQPPRRELYSAAHRPIGLDAAIKAVVDDLGPRPVGLFYTAQRCLLAAWQDGAWQSAGQTLETAEVYEARVFAERGELRWRDDPDAVAGRAVVISETAIAPVGWTVVHAGKTVGSIDQHYLPWGQNVGAPPVEGWQRTTSARIGVIDLPTIVRHPSLRVREYLDVDACNGNSFVLVERLIGFVTGETSEGANHG
jgi:CRISPR-associated protein (TIGR03984 family)